MLWLDTETYSATPITHGTHAYAADAEVMVFSYAIGDGGARVWDVTSGALMPGDLADALESDCEVVIHNSGFDRAVLAANGWHIAPPRIIDTMVWAYQHGLPGGLGPLSSALGLPADKQKDKRGHALIQLFCKPRPKNMKLRRATADTHPGEWAEFLEYARQDIVAMRAVHRALPKRVNAEHAAERALWVLDQRINDRGVCIDLALARATVDAVALASRAIHGATEALTGGIAATQRDALLDFIKNEHGIELPDITRATVEAVLDKIDLPGDLRDLLALRIAGSGTSASKYKRVIHAVNADGRLRGLLQFRGASRTGRWSGRVFQPQNLPRPSLKQQEIDTGIDALKAGAADLLYTAPEVMQIASSALRGLIVAPPGKKLVVSDLSNIEGRILAWLAGEDWKLDAFRAFDSGTGDDLYVLAYARAFGIDTTAVDKARRQIGKVMELALGYEGGVGAFVTFAAAYGMSLAALADAALPTLPQSVIAEATDEFKWATKNNRDYGLPEREYITCSALKRMWRAAHPNVTTFWRALSDAFRVVATSASPRSLPVGRLTVRRHNKGWVHTVLPSGRALCYPGARIDDEGRACYLGVDQYTRKWGRIQTYGGKLAENVTQAVAADVLAAALEPIEASGYEVVLTVHDEVIAEAPDTPEYSADALSALLAAPPAWALDLPLAAAGFETHRYRKD